MNPKFNLLGKEFGRLKVVKFVGRAKDRQYLWECECSCEQHTHIIVKAGNLRSGNTQSCGCLHKEIIQQGIHGKANTKLYYVWNGMKSRCLNPNQKSYKNYGERGIKICDEWLNFNNFYEWAMNNGYKEGLSIERENVNGNYEPSNCHWATAKEQANNTRSNHFIEYNGENKTIQQWEDETGLPIGQRITSNNWSIEKAINTPLHDNYRIYTYNGENHTIAEWSYIKNINYGTLYNRLTRLQWTIEKALETKVKRK